jgi:membrane protein implicated in regulation of membrane protease activity
MACFTEKLAMGAAYVAMVGSAAVAVGGAETVVLTVAGVGLFVGAAASYIASLLALADCLDKADRPDDAAKLRQKADDMQKEIDELKRKVGA